MTSRLRRGAGRLDGLAIERRFPLPAAIRLVADTAGVTDQPIRCWRFGLRLPSWLQPTVAARESVIDDRFHFDVEIGAPLAGRTIRYRGRLRPASAEKALLDFAPGNEAVVAPSE
jgi:hypothetical protein